LKEKVPNTWKLKDLEDLQGRLALNKDDFSNDDSQAIKNFERVNRTLKISVTLQGST